MEEEWELVIDDDFVFKCPKHPTISSASASSSDPAVEESNRKERKKMTLLKLKKRYQQEICHWEHLSTEQHSSDSVSPEFACSLLLQHYVMLLKHFAVLKSNCRTNNFFVYRSRNRPHES